MRIAYCGLRKRGENAAGELGLFGFVFSSGAERNIGVSLCGIGGCGGFGVEGIGFVLHKELRICRGFSTGVERYRGEAGQDRQSGMLKSETISKSK